MSTRLALLFSFTEKYLLLLVATGTSMVIARLLTPAETGIYSVGSVLVALAHVLRDFGIGQYVVQAPVLDRAALRAVLGASYALASMLALILWCAGAPLAGFFREPRLADVLHWLAINFLVIPLTSVNLALLRRQMRFGAVCGINLCYGLTAAAVAVGLAWAGWGYRSLAAATLSASVAAAVASLALRPAGMPWLPSLRGVPRVLSYGAYATGGILLDEAGVVAPDLVVGKLAGMDGAGMFSKAQGVLAVFRNAVLGAVSPVLLPLYARQARAGQAPDATFLQTVSYLTACAWPFFAVAAVTALPLVRTLYGGQWDAAAPLMRILCVASALYSMGTVSRYLFIATGHVRLQARLDALAALVRMAAVAGGAWFGLEGAAWALLGAALFRTWLTCRYLRRASAIDAIALARSCARSAGLALLCGAAAAAMMGPETSELVSVLGAGVAATAAWLGGVVILRHPLRAELVLLARRCGRTLFA